MHSSELHRASAQVLFFGPTFFVTWTCEPSGVMSVRSFSLELSAAELPLPAVGNVGSRGFVKGATCMPACCKNSWPAFLQPVLCGSSFDLGHTVEHPNLTAQPWHKASVEAIPPSGQTFAAEYNKKTLDTAWYKPSLLDWSNVMQCEASMAVQSALCGTALHYTAQRGQESELAQLLAKVCHWCFNEHEKTRGRL